MFGIPVEQMPRINATLNGLAAVLLLLGYALIVRRREQAHTAVMLSAFFVSIAFLTCYLVYHAQVGSVPFQGPPNIRRIYLLILVTHVVLAAIVPFLAGLTIYWGFADRRRQHRRLAKWTLPIWLYVSVTGVVIYVMLYHLYPAHETGRIIPPAGRASDARGLAA